MMSEHLWVMWWWFPWIPWVNKAAHWNRNTNKCNFFFFSTRTCWCVCVPVSLLTFQTGSGRTFLQLRFTWRRQFVRDDRCVLAQETMTSGDLHTPVSSLFQSSAGCLGDDLLLHHGVIIRPRPQRPDGAFSDSQVRNVDLSCNYILLKSNHN